MQRSSSIALASSSPVPHSTANPSRSVRSSEVKGGIRRVENRHELGLDSRRVRHFVSVVTHRHLGSGRVRTGQDPSGRVRIGPIPTACRIQTRHVPTKNEETPEGTSL